jgi:hypothetical protein
MTYTLVLVKDDGSFDKWGVSNIKTIKKQNFDESYGYLENGCESTVKLWNIAKEWLAKEDIRLGEGWVSIYENGSLISRVEG